MSLTLAQKALLLLAGPFALLLALLGLVAGLEPTTADVVAHTRRTLWLVLAGGGTFAAGVTAALGLAFHRGVTRRGIVGAVLIRPS